MNTKTLLKNVLYVLIGIVCAVGISYAAGTFNSPTGNPPANNPATPLNVGTEDQVKSDLFCTTGSCGGLSLGGAFLANQNAALNAQVFINGLMLGGTPNADGTFTDGTLAFGDSTTPASVQVTGNMSTSSAMQADTLKNSAGNAPLCSNAAGQVVVCNIDLCSNIAGNQMTVPAGDVENSDGTCGPAPKEFYASLESDALNTFFGGGVTGGNLNYTANPMPANSNTYIYEPFLNEVGFDNDDPTGWNIDTISGVQGTTNLGAGETRLLDVAENGAYTFTINYSGYIAASGQSSHRANCIEANFYIRVNGQYIKMSNTNASSAQLHEPYPVSTDTTPNVYACGTGTSYNNATAQYNVTFTGTYNLKQGDTVGMAIDLYGASSKTGFLDTSGDFFNSAGEYSNFNYEIGAYAGSSIKITEIPSQ